MREVNIEYLNKVNSPEDLKKLAESELDLFCADIRGFLIENISRTGGHLGSNLGIVELTAALHYIFNSPEDKIIWDVGHQSYPHKIITGRKDKFNNLRQLGGISGFPKIGESIHDVFGTGHSSTALSAAIGLAQADILNKTGNFIIAVIGDGSFTGGLVYEALNNAKNCRNLIVILNDNGMSISKTGGAMADYLANIRTAKKYYKFKRGTKNILGAVPFLGKYFIKFLQHIKKLMRRAVYHTTFFEQLGFDFLGPVDGHDTEKLLTVLKEAKTRENPVFIHVNTKKGKGYKKAEQSDLKYHSVGKFDVAEGADAPAYGYSENFGEKICKAAQLNSKICAVTAAMTEGTGLENFRSEYPDRFFDVGIAEGHAAVFSGGLAAGGFLPVFAVYSSFMQRSYDNIIHDVALQNLHVIFCIDRAGLCGGDGATHHGIFDVSFLNHTPNAVIFSPSSYAEFDSSFDFCLNKIKSPAFIRYPKGSENREFNGRLAALRAEGGLDYLYKKHNGAQFMVVSYGQISEVALEVHDRLNNNGIPAEFLKLNKIKPLDYILPEIINSTAKTVVFIEEGIETGGISQIIAAKLSGKKTKIFAFDSFITHGSNEELLDLYGLSPEKIYEGII